MEKNIKKIVYLLLNYTLKLVSMISEKLKDPQAGQDKEELKKELIKYSVSLVYRISTFVQEQLQIFNTHNKSIKDIMVYNIEIKDEIKDKLDKLITQLQEQNKKK